MSHDKSKQEVICDILTAYKTHPSIKQIEKKFNEQNFFRKEKFSLSLLLQQKLKTLLIVLIQIKPQEQTRFHQNLTLTHLLIADFLTPLLTVAINKSIEENIFPDSAKIASVIPLDKGKPNKNEISNYRPVSVLNTFSKFYEKVIKNNQ